MTEEQKRILERQLWGVANALRGKMHADEYKNYILGFIFYKYLSEKLARYVDETLLASENFEFAGIKENTKEGKKYLEQIKAGCIGQLGFFLKPSELFLYLVKKGKGDIKNQNSFILEDLKNVLNTIEQTSMGTASEDDFKGLFDDVDLTSTKLGSRENQKNDVVVEVLALLSGIDFKLEDTKSDLLGDAYEYLIGEFAAGAGKKGGEFYTPPQVSRLMAQIVSQDKKRVRSVYDPTCGSGSLLLRIGDFTEVASYYGQELNPTTYNLARMNMILHGVHFDHFDIRQGDTLTEDMHTGLKAEALVANPPFSAKWKSDSDPQLAHDDRFSQYGRLAPKSAADYAFVTHMLYHLADNGIMAVILPHGALFRSGAEGQIRKYIIEKQNYLDAVIGLPSNLFYGPSISATVLVFKKCRKDDENILFIDASKEFKKVGNQNKLTDENVKKIFDIYKRRKEIEKYSRRVNLDEIRENEYNLNIPRYVDTFEEEEPIDIEKISKNLSKLVKIEREINSKISKYCEELNLPKPKGNNIPLLKDYKKGVMQKLFSQEIRFKNKKGNNFTEWKKKGLEDIGKSFNGLTGKSGEDFGNGELFITYKQIFDDSKIDINKFALVKVNVNEKQNKAQFGDVFFTTSSETPLEVGFASVLLNKDITPYLNSFSFGFRPNSLKEFDPYYARFFFRNSIFRKEVIKLAQGSTRYNISKLAFMKIKILFPSFPEQQKIAEFLTSIDNLIKSKQQQITQAESWKKGLMQGLFV